MANTAALVNRDEPGEPPALVKRPARAFDDIPDRVKRVQPVDRDVLERVLGGLRALQSALYCWRVGFLSSVLHAVPAGCDQWQFRRQTVRGRPAAQRH